MEASIAIQVLPLNSEGDEVLKIVDSVIEHISKSGLTYEVGPFETTIEGELSELIKLVEEIQHISIKAGGEKIATYMKLFYNPNGGVLGIHEKVDKHRN